MEEDAKMPRRSSRHNSSGSFVRQVDTELPVVRRVSRARNCQPKSTEEESSPDVFENGPVTRRRARRLYSSSTAIKTELLNGVNEGESPLSADTNKSINSTNHRSPPLKKKRLSVDMPVRRRGRPRTRDIQSNHFNHSSASPRRSKREKRLIYRNLSARSIEKEVFKPPIIVDSDGSDTVDPYEKILSPHHRIQLKTDFPTGSPVQMLTRRQRRLLGAGLEQPTDESTPLKTFAAVQTGNGVVRDANTDASANDRWRSLRLRSCSRGEPPAGEQEGEMEMEGEHGETPQQELEKQEVEEGKDNEGEITETGSEEEEEEAGRSYNFRKRRPVTYQDQVLLRLVPQNETQHRRAKGSRHRTYSQAHLRSPAYNQRGRFSKRRRHTTHRSSSSTSSSGEDSDEKHFQRRKSRSMNKARQRCLPVNITHKDMNMASFGTTRDRQRVGASLADVDPMNMDQKVSFGSIGGLQEHIQSLKEMVVFPLLYPEVFKRFNIAPPRGVLFHGAPGCGKTLVARALANECSKGERKVAFFMRKGADCLSKWVGESERQLRLLFDQAYQMRPSIIFFDEIDGLAPVRSSKQDQIHSSIVSTLLALMDGLDNRGEIVVIGATNRIDAIDPAFRRPGRFDREFFFPLPSLQDRIKILQIHTSDWKPKLRHSFLAELAEFTVGYCGADLKALCAESALAALRRIYPQIYATSEKLVINPERILVQPGDFLKAMEKITPASQRVELSPASSLTPSMQRLLSRHMRQLITMLMFVFPAAWKQIRKAEQLYREVDEIHTENRSISHNSEGTPMDCVDSNNLDEVNNYSGHSRDGEDTHLHKNGRFPGTVPVNKLNSVQTGNSSTFSVETILSSSRNEGALVSLPNGSHPNPHTDRHARDSIQGNSSSPPNAVGTSSSNSYQRYTEFYSQMSDSLTGSVYIDPSQSRIQPNSQNIDIYEEEDKEEGADTGHVDRNNPSQSQPTLRQLFSKRVLSVEEADPHRCPNLFRTRLLICGQPCMGQTQHLGPALLHALEGFTQHVLDISALYSIAMRTPEEACHQIFREAKRTAPSIVYIPNMELWWNTAGDTLKSVFTTAAKSVSQTKPLLLLATYEGFEADSTNCIPEVFDVAQGEVFKVTPPSREDRRDYFQDVVLIRPSLPPVDPPKVAEDLPMEELPKAAAAPPQELTEVEKKKLVARREATLRELRVFLRDATNKLMAERKFKEFTKPVDPDEVIDYYDVISKPMDLSTVMKKIDERCYQTAKEWLTDIDLITSNALEYNPENSNESRLLRHRACELQDMAHSFMDHELSEDFEKLCHDLKESAQRVGIRSPVFHPTIPRRSSHRKSHGDELSNLSDDDEMALYRRRSLRQQGVEPQVEGIPYYGPRRARKRAAIDEDEDDDEVTDNGWKSGESFDNERNSSKDTDKEKSDAANETDTLSIGEDNDGGDKVGSTKDGKADKMGGTEDSKADKMRSTKDGKADKEKKVTGEEHPEVTEQSMPDFEETFDNDEDELSSESELIVNVTESHSPDQGHSEGEKLPSDRICTPGDDNPHRIEPDKEKGNSDVSNHTPDKLMVKYPKSVISISTSADGEGKSPTAGNPGNIPSPLVKEDTNSKSSDDVLETQNGKRNGDCSVTEVPPKPREVMIDRVRQLAILDSLVELTEGCNLEVLQKLHSMLGLIVFRHRMEEDRSQLLNEMELLLNTFKS